MKLDRISLEMDIGPEKDYLVSVILVSHENCKGLPWT
jgi:hypothetical protein